MSKTFIYTLLVIAVYVIIIFPNLDKAKSSVHKSETGETHGGTGKSFAETENLYGVKEEKDENGVIKGAGGRLKYGIGAVN